MASARKVTLAQLTQCFQVLSDTCDARLKGSLGGFSAVETLERMVLEMAGAVSTSRRCGHEVPWLGKEHGTGQSDGAI